MIFVCILGTLRLSVCFYVINTAVLINYNTKTKGKISMIYNNINNISIGSIGTYGTDISMVG